MIKRMITDGELISATALVRESMLRTLPEPKDCTGEFTPQFEEKIKKLKKTAERKAAWRRFAKGAVAAVLVVLISFSMLLAFSTETRAAVKIWFTESFGNSTTYWFRETEDKTLPEYELTWVPEGYEVVMDEGSPHMRCMLYQKGDDTSGGFVFDYSIANDNSKLVVYFLEGEQEVEKIDVWGTQGDLYLSSGPDDSYLLVWFDEANSVVFTINTFLEPDDILRIANGVRIVE